MSERILFWIAIAGFAVALVGVGVAFAVSNHPDRAKAAKVFFFIAALVLAVGVVYWTFSTSQGLGVRVVADLLSIGLIAVGLVGGFRFASRSLLADLSLPSTAFVSESAWLQNKKLAALIAVSVLIVIGLMNASREPDPIGRWVWPMFVLVYDFPWRLFVLVVINALVIIVVYRLGIRRQRRLTCPEPRLHDLEEKDKASIKDLVRVTGIHYRPEFDKGSPYIDFTFGFFNISLFDVVVENSIKNGNILFGEDNEKFFYEPRIESKKPILCRSRSANYFVVRQAVRAEEITRFKGANDLLLAFHSLEIVFQGTEQFPEIKSTPLNTHHYLETKKGMWRALDELESVFAFTDEQWALLSETKHEATAVLRAEINSLKSQLEEAKANATPTLPQPIEVAAEPNLVFAPDNKPISVRRDGDGILVEGDYGDDLMVWTVRCKNERQARPIRKVGGINNVYAEVSFRGYGDRYFSIPADRAAWLSERNERVGFPVGVSHRLVIATQRNDKISAVQRRNSTLGEVVNETPLVGGLFRVLVSLFADTESEGIAEFDFMLDLNSPYKMVATSLWKDSHLLDFVVRGYKLDKRHRDEGDSEELEGAIGKWQTEVADFLGAHYSDGARSQFEGKPIGPIIPGAPQRFTLGLPEPKTIYEKLSAQITVLDRLSK